MSGKIIKDRKLKKIRDLQEGYFSSVTLFEDLETQKRVVIKKIFKTKAETNAMQEIEILTQLSKLNHPNIIKFLGFEEKLGTYDLEFEYCEYGDLGKFLSGQPALPEHQAQKVIQQIFAGMQAIHDLRYVHRDLKLENVLIDENYNLKIADFGCSAKIRQRFETIIGSQITMAPEVYGMNYDEKCDIWSFGIMCYRILLGEYPYPETIKPLMLQELLQNPFQVTFPEGKLSKRVIDLLSKMLVQDPNKRISFEELREDDWINGSLFNADISVALADASLQAVSSMDLWYPDTSPAFRERYKQGINGEKMQPVLYDCEFKVGESEGSVYSGYNLWDKQQQVVIKRISKDNKKRAYREINILKKLQSQYTVRLIDHLESEEDCYLVFEKCTNGNLENFIQTHLNEFRLPGYEPYKLIYMLIEIVKSLYSLKLVHGKISLNHILLDADYSPKICGFSEAVFLDETAAPALFPTKISSKQTQYTPPEMLLHQKRCQNSDFWSWGFVFASILQGQTSFESVQQATLGLPDCIKDLIHFMLQEDPAKRIDIVGVMKHPWVCRMESAKSVLDQLGESRWYTSPLQIFNQLEKAEDERKESFEMVSTSFKWEKMNNECSNEITYGRTANGDKIPSKEILSMEEVQHLEVFYSDGAYSGPLKYGKRHGKGEMKFASGESYKGDFIEDIMDGHGEYVWGDGTRYIGPFKNGNREGTGGKYEHSRGSCYTGDVLNNKFCGTGKAVMEDGSSYDGKWKDGQYHGQGTFIFPTHSKLLSYQGEWDNGKMVNGQIQWKNGDIYDGELDGEGNPNGMGVFKWAQGEVLYKGEYKRGTRTGVGTIIYPNGAQYKGNWVNDRMHGWGEISLPTKIGLFHSKFGEFSEVEWENVSEGRFRGKFTTLSGKYYQGGWLMFRKHGYGKSVDADGTTFKGNFSEGGLSGKIEIELPHLEGVKICSRKNDMLESGDKSLTEYASLQVPFESNDQKRLDGKGCRKFKNGCVYFGQWKDNQPHGRGRMIYPNKILFKGEFKNGYRNGRGQEITPDGTRYSGTWRMNKKEGRFSVEDKNGVLLLTEYKEDVVKVNDVSGCEGEKVSKIQHAKLRTSNFEKGLST